MGNNDKTTAVTLILGRVSDSARGLSAVPGALRKYGTAADFGALDATETDRRLAEALKLTLDAADQLTAAIDELHAIRRVNLDTTTGGNAKCYAKNGTYRAPELDD